MTKQISDHAEVWFLMEKADVLIRDFSIDHIVAFDMEDDFCVVIYTASTKHLLCFLAPAYRQNTDALGELIETLQEYETNEKWPEKAVRIVENKLHSKNNSRFFFDAH